MEIVSNDHDANFITKFCRLFFKGWGIIYYGISPTNKWLNAKGSMGCKIGISKIMWMLIIKIGQPSRLGRILL